MVCGLVELLQFDQLPIPIAQNRSPYKATNTIKTGESTKEKTASLPKAGQAGSTTKASIKNCLFKQQTVGTLKRQSGDESVPQQLVY